MCERLQRALQLFLVVSMGTAIWLVVVPRVQRHAGYQARQQLLRSRQVDPSAMFYTELDCLETALDGTRIRFCKGRDR